MKKENTTIYEKLLEVKKQVAYIQKDKDSHQYKYASPSAVLSKINPLLNEQGLILKPEVIEMHTERIFLKPKMVDLYIGGVKTPKEIDVHETLFRLKMKMTWIEVSTGETEVCEWASSGVNGDEKGFGSALTYGLRYFLLSFFNIPTDNDDPDTFQTKHMTADEIREIENKKTASIIAEIESSTTHEQLLSIRQNNITFFEIQKIKDCANKRYQEIEKNDSGKATAEVKETIQEEIKTEPVVEKPKKSTKKEVSKAEEVLEIMAEHDEATIPAVDVEEIIKESEKDKDEFLKSLDEPEIDQYLGEIKSLTFESPEKFIDWATKKMAIIENDPRIQEFKDACNDFYNNNWD